MESSFRLRLCCFVAIAAMAGCATQPANVDATSQPAGVAAASGASALPEGAPAPASSTAAPSRAMSAPAPVVADPAPVPPPPSPLDAQLADAIKLYDAGDFRAAIAQLRLLSDAGSAPVSTQTTALKYLAFSYCVTSKRTLCQQQFEAALRLDPTFELAPAERGHPMWRTAFDRAKKAVDRALAKAHAKDADAKHNNVATKPSAKAAVVARDAKSHNARVAETKSADARKAPVKTVADVNAASQPAASTR